MYRDRRRLRDTVIKIRLNEYENAFVEQVLEMTGEQKAEFMRIMALEGLKKRLAEKNNEAQAV